VILLAPAVFWKRAVGTPGKRTSGKVRDEAWSVFIELVRRCEAHGFPAHFVQFEVESTDGANTKVANVSPVHLPERAQPGP